MTWKEVLIGEQLDPHIETENHIHAELITVFQQLQVTFKFDILIFFPFIRYRVGCNVKRGKISFLYCAYRSSGNAARQASFPVNFSEEIVHEKISNSVDFPHS